jgi:tryptophan synthase alpha chain
VEKVFELVRSLRRKTDVPLVFLTYLNPVLNAGYDKFFARCGALGVDGIIIPDLPFEEKREVKDYAEQNGVDIISMVTPTSHDRIVKIAADASGLFTSCPPGSNRRRDEIITDFPDNPGDKKRIYRAGSGGFGVYTPSRPGRLRRLQTALSSAVRLSASSGKRRKTLPLLLRGLQSNEAHQLRIFNKIKLSKRFRAL